MYNIPKMFILIHVQFYKFLTSATAFCVVRSSEIVALR
jgi:hypothetical protein